MLNILLALALQLPVAGKPNDSVSWDYAVVDQIAGPVTTFLVCLDGQPTSACVSVPESVGIVATSGTKTYTWKLPALLAGPHNIAIQACTTGDAACSSGAVFAFTVQLVIPNPTNVRLTKGSH